jgi:hypothetical protein
MRLSIRSEFPRVELWQVKLKDMVYTDLTSRPGDTTEQNWITPGYTLPGHPDPDWNQWDGTHTDVSKQPLSRQSLNSGLEES